MEGKRFGAGIVGGLLLGLLIIFASTISSFGLYGSFAASPAQSGTGNKSVGTTTTVGPTTTPSGGHVTSANTTNSVSNPQRVTSGQLTIVLNQSSAPQGTYIMVNGSGFTHNAVAWLTSTVGGEDTFQTSPTGTFTQLYWLQNWTTGRVNITAVDGTTLKSVSAPFIITSATTANRTTNPAPPSGSSDLANVFLAPSAAQNPPSRLNSIPAQTALVDGIVLVPLLVALILGAILYRSSTSRKKEEESVEQKT
jgi:hypothetical protein